MNNLNKIYQDLKKKPYHYSFYKACFILEMIHSEKKSFSSSTAKNEPIKLIPYVHASTLHSTCIKFDEDRNAFIINSPALIGFNGILPTYYAEKIFFQERQKKFLLSDFFNIFQHRFFSIKYKLEKKYYQTLNSGEKFTEVFDICGLQNNKLKKILSPFLAILLIKNKTKNNLKKILENLTQTTIDIKEFDYRWFHIPNENQLKLDHSFLHQKAIGTHTKINHAAIKIIFWFENFAKYIQYFKNKTKQKEIEEVIKYFLNQEFEFSIDLKIKNYTTKTFNLNNQNQLGLTTWI